MDNAPKLIVEVLSDWCRDHAIDPRHIQPGKPDQNAFVERFNRSYREDVLDAYVFASIHEVQSVTEEWLEDYNAERPHDSLGGVPPRATCRGSNPRSSPVLSCLLDGDAYEPGSSFQATDPLRRPRFQLTTNTAATPKGGRQESTVAPYHRSTTTRSTC